MADSVAFLASLVRAQRTGEAAVQALISKQLKECGLPIHGANGFLPGRLKSTGPKADHAAIAAYATDIFRRGEEIGMHSVIP